MYVLDTDVLSATAPTKAKPDETVREWIRTTSHDLYLSVVTLMELSYGLNWLRYRGASSRAARLELWIDFVRVHYADRVLPVDPITAIRAGALIALARSAGVEVDSEDAMIAAAADLRGLVVLTVNAKHFAPMGVPYLNPFEGLPTVC